MGQETLLGRHHPQARFPLLLKFLDAADRLSLQVHPDDARAALLDPPDLGKTETWVVLEAAPGSLIYAGLKPGVDRAQFERELARGTCEACFHTFEPRAGDCIFLPAGTVHAIGGGLLMAELQQASDCTFRLFDWNRVGPDGKPRLLHVEQALEVINFAAGPVAPQQARARTDPPARRAGWWLATSSCSIKLDFRGAPEELCASARCLPTAGRARGDGLLSLADASGGSLEAKAIQFSCPPHSAPSNSAPKAPTIVLYGPAWPSAPNGGICSRRR